MEVNADRSDRLNFKRSSFVSFDWQSIEGKMHWNELNVFPMRFDNFDVTFAIDKIRTDWRQCDKWWCQNKSFPWQVQVSFWMNFIIRFASSISNRWQIQKYSNCTQTSMCVCGLSLNVIKNADQLIICSMLAICQKSDRKSEDSLTLHQSNYFSIETCLCLSSIWWWNDRIYANVVRRTFLFSNI